MQYIDQKSQERQTLETEEKNKKIHDFHKNQQWNLKLWNLPESTSQEKNQEETCTKISSWSSFNPIVIWEK